MILVDIYFPAVDRTIDFRLDERVQIKKLVDEITEMLAQLMRGEAEKGIQRMLLCDYQSGRILPPNMTLEQCGIRNGYRLLAV